MDIVLHAGVHFTEEDRLMKCLLRNKDHWAPRGISVPGPGRYRALLRDTLIALRGADAASDAREILLDAILDQEAASRMILSHPHIFGVAHAVVKDGMLYPEAPARLSRLTQLFCDDRIELFMAIRNPATFLPAAFQRSGQEDMAVLLRGFDPRELRWSDTFEAMRSAAPEVKITVWCNEDAPIVWERVMRSIAGLGPDSELAGALDVALDLMSREGRRRYRTFLGERPTLDLAQRARVTIAFLDKYANHEALEEEVDLPGWTDALIAELTEIYEADVDALRQIPGLTLIDP